MKQQRYRHFIALRHHAQRAIQKQWRTIQHEIATLNFLHIAEGTLILLVAVQLTLIGFNRLNIQQPILGLRLEGHLIGTFHNTDFRKQAEGIIQTHLNKPLSVKAANQTSTITMRQLGEVADPAPVYATLLNTGRTGNAFTQLLDQNQAVFGSQNVLLGHPNFNSQLAQDYIATLDQKIDIAPTNAYFAFEQQKVTIHPDAHGRIIDAEPALQALQHADPESGAPVTLPVKQTPALVTTTLLRPLLPSVQRLAQQPLAITAGASSVTLTPEQLVGLVVPKIIPDPEDAKKQTAEISFDEAKLNAIVDGVVKQVTVAPQPTIMRGGQVVRQGKSGLTPEDSRPIVRVLAALVQRQTGAAMPGAVQLPLVSVDPPVVQEPVSVSASTRTGTGLVRLTFDDGPGAHTQQVLDILKRYNVHATFYVIGRNVQRYPGDMQRIVNEGHRVGNHSFSHSDLATLSRAGVQQELSATQTAVQQACGVTPTAFRPPYGSLNATVRDVAASLGMSIDLWSVDPRDWAQPGSSVIKQRVLAADGAGSVVLLHVLYQQTVDALPGIIEGIRAQGYTLE